MTDHSDLIERLEREARAHLSGIPSVRRNVAFLLADAQTEICALRLLAEQNAAALREQQAEVERLTGDLNDHRIIIEMTSDQRDRIAAERKELKEFLQDFVAAKFEEIVPRDGHLPPESRAESVTPFSTIEAWQDDARAALGKDGA